MAPLLKALEHQSDIESVICIAGPPHGMLQQVLDLFELQPHYRLGVMATEQDSNSLYGRLYSSLSPVLNRIMPDRVLVHGDTTTAMAGMLAAFHGRIPVGHVEAGLRIGDPCQPRPEEMNRRCIDVVSDLLFAPTLSSKINLAAENISGKVLVTGNTVIDALRLICERINRDITLRNTLDAQFPYLDPHRKLLLVAGHRRGNFGAGFENVCAALAILAARPDIQIVYPVHLNPGVQKSMADLLSHMPNVHLVPPLDYLLSVRLMQRAHVILTDSDEVQEEAPSLGKPVLVMRDVTERPEAMVAGTVQLVGTEARKIVEAVGLLCEDDAACRRFSRHVNPYGDGYASERIVAAVRGKPVAEFIEYQFAGAEITKDKEELLAVG
jgi:UDP-N-acetylglucosamine 2-epimerase (non-hydrolysing)